MIDLHPVRSIAAPQILHIHHGGYTFCGGTQMWYPGKWQQQSGCGPTCCTHLLWYLAQTRKEWDTLCPRTCNDRDSFLSLMQDVWRFVTPGIGGTTTGRFVRGATSYAEAKGLSLTCSTLKIPFRPLPRPAAHTVGEFLADALAHDLPVGFLNYSNGSLTSLSSWHWVLLVALSSDLSAAVIYDHGRQKEINLAVWLHTSLLGGSFVVLGG